MSTLKAPVLIDPSFKVQNQANRDALDWLPTDGGWRSFSGRPERLGVGLSTLKAYGLAEMRHVGFAWEFRATQRGMDAIKTFCVRT